MKTIQLNGDSFSYIIGIDANDRLRQVYFGEKLNTVGEVEIMQKHYAWSLYDANAQEDKSLDNAKMEFPTAYHLDFGISPLTLHNENDNFIYDLKYVSHDFIPDKPAIKGLPSARGGETLVVTLEDKAFGIKVLLYYSVVANVLCKHVEYINTSENTLFLDSAYSSSLDLAKGDYEVNYLAGTWSKERHIKKIPLSQGKVEISNNVGGSGHQINPFVMLAEKNATENTGKVYGFCIVYSGNHSTVVEQGMFGRVRVINGINPDGFAWELAKGESFCTPEVILSYSACGFETLSHSYHDVINKYIVPEKFINKERPILINNWEATYFDFNEDKILNIARCAKDVGIELFVLDDGWFGKRNDDTCSLGDYNVNLEKLPSGLSGLAKKVNEIGMDFGIWFEPEMISENSDLFRTHPDWRIEEPFHTPTLGRNQYVLDLTKKETCDYIIKSISDILSSANISYVKWDMNRHMSNMPVRGFNHKYILGFYYVLDSITKAFPNVLFEGCSGGGGRFDTGVLAYMPQIWTSDDTDAIERLKIQYGTSMFAPLSTMGAHVTAVPNHIAGRVTPLNTRFLVALSGNFGYELDITSLPQEELVEIKEQVELCKKYRKLIMTGTISRIVSPFNSNYNVLQVTSCDENTVFLFMTKILCVPSDYYETFYLKNLDPNAKYISQEGKVFNGDMLMHMGFDVEFKAEDFNCQLQIFTKQ